MFLRGNQDERSLAALNAPQRSVAVIGKCVAILALSTALVVVIGGDRHVFGPPLVALLLTALVATGLVSLRPRLFLAPLGVVEKDEQHKQLDQVPADSAQSLFMSTPVPSLLIDCESRRLLAANVAAAELYGYAPEALPGLPMTALLAAAANLEEAQGEGPVDGLGRHQRADGSAFWADLKLRCIEHHARPAWLLAVTDASTRMNLAQELQASERFGQDLLDLSVGIVFSHDLDGSLRMVNPVFARALGYTKDELTGKNLSTLLVPSQHDAFTGYLMNIHQEHGSSGIVHLQRRDGAERIWEFRNRLRMAADGSQSILCCANDISERSRNERRLLETSREDPLSGCDNRRPLQVSRKMPNQPPVGAQLASVSII